VSSETPFCYSGAAEIVAHRGYSGQAPENTLAAMRAAVDAGADAVEFDLHPAVDGTPMLIHDDTLNRTTNGRGRVDRHTSEALARLDAGSWFGEDYAGEPLPRLDETLAWLNGRVERVYAEIKSYRDRSALDGVVAAVVENGLEDRVVYISMDWEALARIRQIDPESYVGYIVDKKRRTADAIELAAGDPRALLDFDQRILLANPQIAQRVTDAGVPLAAWTVNTVEQAEALLALGCPRITTNEVDVMMTWKKSL